MCGIYGGFSLTGAPLRHPELLPTMGGTLHHRGPDGHATLERPEVVFGTERLRIIDLDQRADQPFATPEGDCWIACNGEIYNSRKLRNRFPDYPFISGSDVESALPLFRDLGRDALEALDGMFGLAFWNRNDKSLLLARDRAGEKPLFYTESDGEVWFASEIQSLLENPEISRALDPVAIDQFLALGYVLEPRTLFAAIHRVEAGTSLLFDATGNRFQRYWEPRILAQQKPTDGHPVDILRDLLERAVAKQVIADVPVGVFTSGGLDSSLLAALAAHRLGVGHVHTFAARFTASSYDEGEWARRVAAEMGTHHVEVGCDTAALTEAFNAVSERLAEPLADPAILPTFLLAREATKSVTVILSGEGADELFGGYPTYLGHKVAPWFSHLPGFLRALIRRTVASTRASTGKVTVEFLLKRFLASADMSWAKRHLRWFASGSMDQALSTSPAWLTDLLAEYADLPPLAGAMLLDYETYLPDDLLVKVDRATMMHSVEARAPFLDRDLSRFALSLPAHLKVRHLTTKWILKRAARKWLPDKIISRRKRGLSVPVASWINNGLRSEVDRLLEPIRLRRQGLVDASAASTMLAEHRAGRANHARSLWTLVVLERWLERWVPGGP